MGDVASHHKGESPHARRPEYVGIGRGLRAPLQHALVDGTQLVHVVALVGSAAGVHE